MKFKILFIAGMIGCQLATAQMGRYTEEDVKLQELFIAANGQKLQGNFSKAIGLFEQFLEKERNNAAAAYELARLYDLEEKNDEAVKTAEKAVENDPTNEWYQMFLADLYLKTNRDDKAAEVYEKLVKTYPNEEDYYFKWAYFLVRASKTQDAIKVYDELEKKMGVNEEITRRKNSLYLGIGDYKKAQKELDILIEKYPKNAAYRHLLANFFEQTGNDKAARAVYQEILQIAPNDAQAKIALADGKKKQGSSSDYFANLHEVFKNPNVHIDVKVTELFPVITKVADTGDKALAAEALELAYLLEEVHPNQAKSYSVIGDLLYYSGDKKKALDYYQKTLDYDKNVYLVWEQMLYIYADLKDYKNLVKESENALDLFPNQATVYYLNGLGYNGLEKNRDAVSSLQQALLMSNKNPRIQFLAQTLLGKTYNELKQYERSDKSFSAALSMNPKDPMVLSNYGASIAKRESGDLTKAREMTEMAVEIAPNRAAYEYAHGQVLYAAKDYKEAKKWLGKAVENSGEKNAAVLENYGDVLFQLGEQDSAVNYWQKALALGASSAELERKIAEKKIN